MNETRLPPHSIAAENIVLASMMLGEGVAPIRQIVGPDDFYRPEHQWVCAALYEMADAGTPIDLNAVAVHFGKIGLMVKLGAGNQDEGYRWLDNFTSGVANTGRAVYYAKQLRDHSVARKVIAAALALREAAYEPSADVGGILDDMQTTVLGLQRDLGRHTSLGKTIQDAAREVVERVETITAGQPDPRPPIATGYIKVDEALTGGFRPGELITLAGATSTGKTALAACFASQVCLDNGGVLFWSAEMDARELAQRFIQNLAGVGGDKIRRGVVTPAELAALQAAEKRVAGWRLFLACRTGTWMDVQFEAQRIQQEWHGGMKLLIVDYIQLLTGTDKRASKAERIGEIAWGLKQVALGMRIPVVILSQFSREGVKSGKPPELWWLKESGDIENHSNIVIMLDRPDLSAQNANLAIRKNR
ncbi:unnamed protein product, partial [marine sediment metagenome]